MLACTKCMKPVPPGLYNTPELSLCPNCGALIQLTIFPAFFKALPDGTPGEALLLGNEASCFYHPLKKAVVPCAACGRFLCALCDVEMNGNHLCPSCLGSGKKKRKIKDLETRRILYDNIALSLVILPLLIWPMTLITAPMTIFVVFYFWKAPTSIIPRTKIRFVIALLVALIQLGGWGLLFFNMLTA